MKNDDPTKELAVVNLDALDPETRAAAEREIEAATARRNERLRLERAFAEVREIRKGVPGRPVPEMPASPPAPSTMPTPQGAEQYARPSAELPMVRGKDSKMRADGKGSIVSGPHVFDDGTVVKQPRRAMGFSHAGVDIVAVDENGDEIRRP